MDAETRPRTAGSRAKANRAARRGSVKLAKSQSRTKLRLVPSSIDQLSDQGHDVNHQGNPETLVSSHPGNTNAGKAGVYSARMLAPRAAEIEAAISDRPAAEIRREVIQHDLSGLWALLEAVDTSFAGRVINSRNQAKDLLAIRLRLSKTIRAAAQEYEGLGPDPRDLADKGASVDDAADALAARLDELAAQRKKSQLEESARNREKVIARIRNRLQSDHPKLAEEVTDQEIRSWLEGELWKDRLAGRPPNQTRG
jgi:hypothetical protein